MDCSLDSCFTSPTFIDHVSFKFELDSSSPLPHFQVPSLVSWRLPSSKWKEIEGCMGGRYA
jgi:hypothetical protein